MEKKHLIFLRRLFVLPLLFIFVLLSNLHSVRVLFNNNMTFSNVVFLIIIILTILSFEEIKFNLKEKKNWGLFLLWLFWGLSTSISMFIHDNLRIDHLILYIIVIPIFMLVEIPTKNMKEVLLLSFITLLPLLYWIGFGNTIGMMFSLLGIISYMYINNYVKYNIILMIFLVSLITFILFLTESRTSLLAFLVSVISVFVLNIFRNKKKRFSLKTILLITSLVFFIISVYSKVESLIFNKYTNSRLDIFSSRTIMWEGAINDEKKLFGNGIEYFNKNFGIGDSHNTLIEILSVYGLVAFVVFILLVLSVFLSTIKNYKLNSSKFVLSAFFLFFLLLSMGENLSFIDSRMILISFMFIFLQKVMVQDDSKTI